MRFVTFACFIASLNCYDALNIDCEVGSGGFGYDNARDAISSGPSCKARSLDIYMKNHLVTSINGQSAVSTQRQNIKTLIIKYQTIRYMPKGLESFFPNLEEIVIQVTNLRSLEKSDLEPFPNLKGLYVDGNELETIDSDLLINNLELRWVDFERNNLKSVGVNQFDKLTKLEHLSFSRNPCIDKTAASNAEIPALLAELKVKCPLASELATTARPLETTTVKSISCHDELDKLQNTIKEKKTALNMLSDEFFTLRTTCAMK